MTTVAQTQASIARRRPRFNLARLVGRVLTYALLIFGAFLFMMPFLWMVSGSLKTQDEINQPGGGPLIPRHGTTDNYEVLFERVSFGGYLVNTVYVASVTALLTTLVSAMGGYALAKYAFRGKSLVTGVVLGTMLLPPVVLLAPLFKLVHALRLIDSFWGLILPGAASGFGVLIMRQYLRSVPNDLIDAGRLDGASEWRIFWSVILPLIRPITSALLIFTFLGSWNAYLWPMIVLRDDRNYLLTVAITNVVASTVLGVGV